MKKIAFDVMGNDNGVRAAVEAVVEFSKKNFDFIFILVGDRTEINKYTRETERIIIKHAPNTVDKTKGARSVRSSSDTSLVVALNLVLNGEADAIVSSGESGAYLSLATLLLKRLEGVKRPAFMPIFPTIIKDQKFLLLDVGANLETTSIMLYQWAQIASIFSKYILKIKNPKVNIINIGTEETKGKDFHQEAYQLLKKDKKINFKGFVEPRDLLLGDVDVAVCDGYGGNLILKSMEGSVLSLLKLIKQEIKSKTKYKIGGLLAKGAFKNVANVLDYRNVGAAWIIGLNGLAIKCHGSADYKSYLGALNQVKMAVENNALQKIKEKLKVNG